MTEASRPLALGRSPVCFGNRRGPVLLASFTVRRHRLCICVIWSCHLGRIRMLATCFRHVVTLFEPVNLACPLETMRQRECTSDYTRTSGPRVSDPQEYKETRANKGCLIAGFSLSPGMKLMSPRSRDQSPYEPLKPALARSSVRQHRLDPVTAIL